MKKVLAVLMVALLISGCSMSAPNSDLANNDTNGISSNVSSEQISDNTSSNDATTSEPSDVTTSESTNETSSDSNDENTTTSSESTDSTPSEDVSSQKPVHKHSYVVTSQTDATCEKDGKTVYTCSCGDSYSKSIKSPGHNWGEWVIKKEATTTQTGFKAKTCSVCKQVNGETIEKLTDTTGTNPSIEISQTALSTVYSCGRCSLGDFRTWGAKPSITLYEGTHGTSMHVVYYNKNNEKIEFPIECHPVDYVMAYIDDDGTWGCGRVGNFS